MFLRQLLPVTKAVRPCLTTATRGFGYLPRVGYPPFNPYEAFPCKAYYGRAGPWTDPWYYDCYRPYPFRPFEDPALFDYTRRMDRYLRFSAWRKAESVEQGHHAEVLKARLEKDGLHLELNVCHYEPDELLVKVVGDRLIITGKHTHKPDEHGFVAREFTREFLLPEGVNHESLTARLTDNDTRLIIAGNIEAAGSGRPISISYDAGDKGKDSDD